MANYECTIRTNYFRVTDEEKYRDLFSGLIGEDDIHDFTKTADGKTLHGFGSYGWIDYCGMPEGQDAEPDFDEFLEELQDILPEDEAFIMVEGGNEKLRYVYGGATVVTSKEIRYMDLRRWAVNTASEMLGNPEFDTDLEY